MREFEIAAAGFLRHRAAGALCACERSQGNVDVPAEQAALAEQVYKSGKPVITLALGSPYLIERFPQAEDVDRRVWNQRRGTDFDGARAVRRDSDSRPFAGNDSGDWFEGGIWS